MVILNYVTQVMDYIFLISVYVYDIQNLTSEKSLAILRINGITDIEEVKELQKKLVLVVMVSISVATIQLLLTLYLTAYHNVHITQ